MPQGNTLLSNDEQFNLNATNVLNNITGNNYQNNNLKNSDFNTDSQQFQNYSQNFTNQNFTNQRGNNYSLMNQNLRTNIIQDFKCKSFPDFKGNMPNLIQNEKTASFYTDYKKFLENFLHEDRNINYKISIYQINDINLNQRIINSIQYKIPIDHQYAKKMISDLNIDKFDYISKKITNLTVDESSFDIYHSIFKLAFICLIESDLSIRAQASIKIQKIIETGSLLEYHFDFSYCYKLLNQSQVFVNPNNLSIVCPLINYLYCKFVHDDLTQDIIFSHILSFVSNVFKVLIKLFYFDEEPVKMHGYTSKNNIERKISLIKYKDNLIMLYEGSINSVEKSTVYEALINSEEKSKNTMKKEFSLETNVSKPCPITKSKINFSFC